MLPAFRGRTSSWLRRPRQTNGCADARHGSYLARQLGRPVSDNTMIYTWRIPYFRDGRDAIYLRSVLDRFIAERIAKVSQQVFGNAV